MRLTAVLLAVLLSLVAVAVGVLLGRQRPQPSTPDDGDSGEGADRMVGTGDGDAGDDPALHGAGGAGGERR